MLCPSLICCFIQTQFYVNELEHRWVHRQAQKEKSKTKHQANADQVERYVQYFGPDCSNHRETNSIPLIFRRWIEIR